MSDREAKPTKRQLRLVDAAVEVRANPSANPDYVHTVLTSVYLPVRDQGPDRQVWDRHSGDCRLRIEAGSVWSETTNDYVRPGLPFGPRARLLVIYLTTQAVKRGSPEIPVGDSLRQFLRSLGLSDGGNIYASVKDQLRRLAAATILLTRLRDGGGSQFAAARIVEAMEVWAASDPRQRMLWQDTVTLSRSFYESVRASPVPLDDKAVAELANNATALDIYAWLAGRLHRIHGTQFVPWDSLFQQFASDSYQATPAGLRRFRQNFRATLRKVGMVYDAVRLIEDREDGLLLPNAPPPVSKATVAIKSLRTP
jgi:hypothetical protein